MNQENNTNVKNDAEDIAEKNCTQSGTYTANKTRTLSKGIKVLNIVRVVFTWSLVVIAVFVMIFTLVSVNTLDDPQRDLFGYQVRIVLSDSMSKTDFSAGDLVFIKKVDPSTLREGDIITFTVNRDNSVEYVTHKIRSIVEREGYLGFVTYGTTTGVDDEDIVTDWDIVGKYEFSIPKLGLLFRFMKTTEGYIVCILIPFVLLILLQGINSIRLFRRYKAEQMEEVRAEREELEEERRKSQAMMEELLQLKRQLSDFDVKTVSEETTADIGSEGKAEDMVKNRSED